MLKRPLPIFSKNQNPQRTVKILTLETRQLAGLSSFSYSKCSNSGHLC
ncbi:hypothetical protein QMY54_04998 [Pseudomonas rhodesiae]|nr:hypothetical protein QMY54_04998 [Pseudomonas rhodesiae]